ncbi:MAG: endonuclease/exonuclease/phosphatase family protein [Propionibacteriaceae bacterium]|jgi:exodeoxyribonuclease-3|nr:endonuclease/exonuclease/phosphatase family protein [Propionibacteriaceae bacterium]
MRLISLNLNGLRASARRGFRDWLETARPDVLALQEVRCPPSDIPPEAVAGWHWTLAAGRLAGRNGVALLSAQAPSAVRVDLDGADEFADEGRYLEADFDLDGGGLTVASLYLPKGAVPQLSPAAQAKHERKLRFCQALSEQLAASLARAGRAGRQFTVLGDFNIARTPQDLHNNHSRQPLDGFLPDERDWLTGLIDQLDLVDVVRRLHPDQAGPYSWWSWRGQAWSLDRGWRIDYHLSTPGLAERARRADTERAASYEARLSDHAPVVVEYE